MVNVIFFGEFIFDGLFEPLGIFGVCGDMEGGEIVDAVHTPEVDVVDVFDVFEFEKFGTDVGSGEASGSFF